ncbi:MAG: peptidoglycan editing factor PgeF [Candidatus Krumholzibacteriota bacterium]
MLWIDKSGLRVGVFPALEIIAPRLNFYFFSRAGGVSSPPFDSLNTSISTGDSAESVRQNRRLILKSINIKPEYLAEAEQVHGSNIRIVDKGGLYRETDGFITGRDETALAVSTADCCPVFIYSPPENALAALHVGRKGAAAGIITPAMDKLRNEFSIAPELAVSLIGPAICGQCYEVSGDIASEFAEDVVTSENGRYYLDLPLLAEKQLISEGISPGNIFRSGLCTSCQPEHFFSHRRDRGKTGRHWSVAFIKER